MLLRAIASGCILCKLITLEPGGRFEFAFGIFSMTILKYFASYSVLAKQKDDRFYAPASYCFWLHPLQIAKLAKMH